MEIFPLFDWKVHDVDKNVIKQSGSYKLLLETWVAYNVDEDNYLVPVRIVWQVPDSVDDCFAIIRMLIQKGQEVIDKGEPIEEFKHNGHT